MTKTLYSEDKIIISFYCYLVQFRLVTQKLENETKLVCIGVASVGKNYNIS